jgi:hypothetical protein
MQKPAKPAQLCNLGISQRIRFDILGNPTDIESAISNLHIAIKLTDTRHPERSTHLTNLGYCYQSRFLRLREPADIAAALSALKEVAQSKTAYPHQALKAARFGAQTSVLNGDIISALDGYRTALEVLLKVAWLGLDVRSQHDWLRRERPDDLGCLAATCAIQLGHLEEAIELLDLGRSVFWQKASSLRIDFEVLREEAPELANELEDVGRQLDVDNFSCTTDDPYVGFNRSEEVGRERRRLVGVWEGLLASIRRLPKFKYFLKPKPFDQLRQIATVGQVIIINTSHHRVDALIFGATGPIAHVPLVDINPTIFTELASNIISKRPVIATTAQRQNYINPHLRPTLRTVWEDILLPIFTKIQIPLDSNPVFPLRRIWWYPTGPLIFIPLHAAGPRKGVDVSHLVVSSYVMTLDSLFQAQKKTRSIPVTQLKLLAISQSNTPGYSSIPQSVQEVLNVVEVARSAGWAQEGILPLHGSDATVKCVSSALDSSSWAHFTCHGLQHPILGMKSALALHDGPLELGHIASKQLSAGQFAFLSVCHAASGLIDLPGDILLLVFNSLDSRVSLPLCGVFAMKMLQQWRVTPTNTSFEMG